jgi:hypothetical protein
MTDTNSSATQAAPSKRLYKSARPTCTVYMTDGTPLKFVFGRFITAEEDKINFLDRAIARNEFGGNVYIDPHARTISEAEENPMKALEKQIIARYLAEQAAHTNLENNFGDYEQGKLNAASTTDIAPVAAGGDGSAKLMISAALLAKSGS